MGKLQPNWRYVGAVLRFALAPAFSRARMVSNLVVWVQIALVAVCGLLGITAPSHLHVSRSWWLAVSLGFLALLFLTAAYRLYAASIRTFPDVLVSVNPVREGSKLGSTVIFPPEWEISADVLVVNREPAKGLSMTFVVKVFTAEGKELLTLGNLVPTPKPLDLAPEKSDTLTLGPYRIPPEAAPFLPRRDERPSDAILSLKPGALHLVVTDHISGKSISFPIPGRYEQLSPDVTAA